MTEHQEKLRQCLWISELCRQSGLTYRMMRQMLQTSPDLESIMSLQPNHFIEQIKGSPERNKRLINVLKDRRWTENLVEKAKDAAAKGIHAVFCGDSEFPDRLKEISGCPIVLYYRGEHYQTILNQNYFVTVIGTRAPTAYGRIVTERIVAGLTENNVVIVSGLARGIDAVAHQTALKKQGFTIAVVGNGPDLVYPPENAGLMTEIIRQGVVISEHPPGTPPRRQHFPARNRILSGLADSVAVMEASSDSGTMITAGFAGDQGRDVFAVPGSILSPFSQGCNQLIRDGAGILESAQDILWRLPMGCIQTRMEQWLRQNRLNDAADNQVAASSNDPFSPIRQLLAGCPLTLSEISERMNLSIEQIAAQMTIFELEGWIKCERGRYSLTESALFCI